MFCHFWSKLLFLTSFSKTVPQNVMKVFLGARRDDLTEISLLHYVMCKSLITMYISKVILSKMLFLISSLTVIWNGMIFYMDVSGYDAMLTWSFRDTICKSLIFMNFFVFFFFSFFLICWNAVFNLFGKPLLRLLHCFMWIFQEVTWLKFVHFVT